MWVKSSKIQKYESHKLYLCPNIQPGQLMKLSVSWAPNLTPHEKSFIFQ